MPDINDKLIPPQIINDELFEVLYHIAQNKKIKTFLEIGCSGGEGSTKAIISGLQKNPNYPDIRYFGIEASPIRFEHIRKFYKDEVWAKFYNVITVPIHMATTDDELREYYKRYSHMNWMSVDDFIKDKHLQYEYFNSFNLIDDGIDFVKNDSSILKFDAVFIDGGAYTGYAEYKKLYGARFIILDDIIVPKCLKAYEELSIDKNYTLVAENKSLRFGYVIFERILND